jgi:hypothetical protein
MYHVLGLGRKDLTKCGQRVTLEMRPKPVGGPAENGPTFTNLQAGSSGRCHTEVP